MKKYYIFFVVLLLTIFTIISLSSALHESLTYDEVVHLQEGKNAWLHHTFAIDTNNPPLERELATLPLLFHIDTFTHAPQPPIRFLPARGVTIVLSLLLLLSVFLFTKQFLGLPQAYIALLLLLFDPNILANNHYVTFDVGFTLFFFLAYMWFLKIVIRPMDYHHPHVRKNPDSRTFLQYTYINVEKELKHWKTWVLVSLAIGLGLASKVSFIPFFILSPILALVLIKKQESVRWVWERKFFILGSVLLSLMIVWGTYFFTSDVIIAQRADTGRVSAQLQHYATMHHNTLLQSFLSFGEHQKIPLGNYIAMIKNNTIRNTKSTTYFFFGTLYPSHHWYFMIENIFFKTPLPILILFVLSIILAGVAALWDPLSIACYGQENKEKPMFSALLVPIMVIVLVISFTNTQPLIRYVLPIYPFMAIVAAHGIVVLKKNIYGKLFVAFLLTWYIITSLASYPHFISYTNEFVSSQKQSELLFTDSNMDWGQSLPDLHNYIIRQKPQNVVFSYFGRDNGDLYGMKSDTPYGSYKFNEICAFHTIPYGGKNKSFTAISLSNWYNCGYNKMTQYKKDKIKEIVGHSILVF